MNFHFDLCACVHVSADLCHTVHMCERVAVTLSYITAGAMKYTALHVNVMAMTHTPLVPLEVVPAHIHTNTLSQSFYISIAAKLAVFPFSVMLPSPPAVLFNKSLSAHLLSTCVRMCIYACVARSWSQWLSPVRSGHVRAQSSFKQSFLLLVYPSLIFIVFSRQCGSRASFMKHKHQCHLCRLPGKPEIM